MQSGAEGLVLRAWYQATAVGPGAVRGAWGRLRGLGPFAGPGGAWPWGGEGGVLNVIKDKLSKFREKT